MLGRDVTVWFGMFVYPIFMFCDVLVYLFVNVILARRTLFLNILDTKLYAILLFVHVMLCCMLGC